MGRRSGIDSLQSSTTKLRGFLGLQRATERWQGVSLIEKTCAEITCLPALMARLRQINSNALAWAEAWSKCTMETTREK